MAYADRYRTAALAVDLALAPDERANILERIQAGAPAVRAQPVCALIAMGINYDDALPWVEPIYEDEAGWAALTEEWDRAVTPVLPAGEEKSAWQRVCVQAAAYLHGRTPTQGEVIDLGRRAATDGLPLLGGEHAARWRVHYDRWASETIPGGMYTARIAESTQPVEPVAIQIVSDALGRPVPEAGKYIKALVLSPGHPGEERVVVTEDPEQALWFPSQGAAHAYWVQQHGLRPWDAKPNRPLTQFNILMVTRTNTQPPPG